MNMKRLVSLLLAGGCLLSLAACGKKETASSGSASSESVAISVPPMLDEIELDKLLTVQEVSDAVGKEVGEPAVYEDGIWIQYRSEDMSVTVDINMEPASEDFYTARLDASYEKLEEDPATGPNAKWSAETGELLNLSKGYMISVRAEISKAKEDTLRGIAQQLMALLVGRIPA